VVVNSSDPIEQFLLVTERSMLDGTFAKAVLAKPRPGTDILRVTLRLVTVRGEQVVSCVQSYATKDVTKNIDVADVRATLRGLLQASFLRGHLISSTENIDLSISKKGKAVLHQVKANAPSQPGAATATAVMLATQGTPEEPGLQAGGERESGTEGGSVVAVPHDRVKQRFVDVNRRYLVDLGVTLDDGRVIPAMARKWKQINKFVETLDGALKVSALRKSDSVRVVDFGAGKGYLTFALHDHLQTTLGKTTAVTGVELRDSLVDEANEIARKNSVDGLQFVCGDIATVATEGSVDVMVALHACDVATDMAIHRGITAGASIIVCSPCCHKDVRRQMQSPEVLQPLLQFGVHLGQEADMVTDTIRALLLEANGYDTKVFEFVGLEHSGKNKMILGVARTQPDTARAEQALAQVAALKKFYSITHQRLETLLNGTGKG
jgi:protein-L-isoaspartate O-methyltransferase